MLLRLAFLLAPLKQIFMSLSIFRWFWLHFRRIFSPVLLVSASFSPSTITLPPPVSQGVGGRSASTINPLGPIFGPEIDFWLHCFRTGASRGRPCAQRAPKTTPDYICIDLFVYFNWFWVGFSLFCDDFGLGLGWICWRISESQHFKPFSNKLGPVECA